MQPSRHELRTRKRRIIWNNDGDELNIPANWNAPGAEWADGDPAWVSYDRFTVPFQTVDDYLCQRMKGKLEGTQVDSIFYCGYCTVPNWEFPTENTHLLGPDPLKHVVDFAHNNNMEFFYSFRMNDIHLAAHRASWLWSRFRMENLDLLQGPIDPEWFETKFLPWVRGESPDHPLDWVLQTPEAAALFPNRTANPLAILKTSSFRTWAAFDFGKKRVREYYLGLIREACRRYDLEGIELDWGRTPPYFRTEHYTNCPVMTDFIRQIRRQLDAWAEERGRAVLLATRVPDTPEQSRDLGLDVAMWLEEDLIDILVAGFGSKAFTYPIDRWAAMGHDRGVPVYGCIENGLAGQGKKETIRATAQRYWKADVDGVYLYNHFEDDRDDLHVPGWPVLKLADTMCDIGDPVHLHRLDKTYCVDWYGGGLDLPVRLSTESGPSRARIRMEIAEDPAQACDVTVEMQWETDVDPSRMDIRLNDEPVGPAQAFVQPDEADDQGWYRHVVTSLREGANTLEVTARPDETGQDKFLLKQVRFTLRYG